MAIVPTVSELVDTGALAVTLPLYAQAIGYDECAFFGVVRQDPPAVHSNKPLWIKSERDQVAHFLAEAQAEIEEVVNFPLSPRWITDENHAYANPVVAEWGKVIEAGVEASSDISLGEAVDYTSDPAQIGPVATTVTETDEIKVYHPGTDVEIHPSSVSISGGNVTILIPRCRLLTEDGQSEGGIGYTDTGAGSGYFEQTVDVKRVYNDDSTNAKLIWTGRNTSSCASCSNTEKDACMVIVDSVRGEFKVRRASYSSGTWTHTNLCGCSYPDRMELNYRAGLQTLTGRARDSIIRLAHSKMPHSPCNCDPANWMWERDRVVPEPITRERLNCPFGITEGAWIAWTFARSMQILRGSIL